MRRWIAAAVGLLALSGCDRLSLFRSRGVPHGSGPIVAKVDGYGITQSDFIDRAKRLEPRFLELNERERRLVIDQVLRFEVLFRAAERRGLQQDADVQDAWRRLMVQRLLQDELDARVKIDDVKEEEVRAHYEAHRSDYFQPGRARLLWFVAKEREAAERVHELLQKDRKVTSLLNQEGNQAAALNLDEASFYTEEELVGRFGPAGTTLFDSAELGSPTAVVESDLGFVVGKLTGKKSAVSRPFEQVRDTIRQRLHRERRTGEFDALVKRYREDLSVWLDSEIEHSIAGASAPGNP